MQGRGQQGGGGGLTVGSGNDQGLLGCFAAEEEMTQGLGHGEIGDSQLCQSLGLREHSLDHVADNDQIRAELQVLWHIALHNLDACLGKEVGHGRVDILIRARDPVAALLEHASNGGHASAADPHDMDMVDALRHRIELWVKQGGHENPLADFLSALKPRL